jgi:hypothetical protein
MRNLIGLLFVSILLVGCVSLGEEEACEEVRSGIPQFLELVDEAIDTYPKRGSVRDKMDVDLQWEVADEIDELTEKMEVLRIGDPLIEASRTSLTEIYRDFTVHLRGAGVVSFDDGLWEPWLDRTFDNLEKLPAAADKLAIRCS